MFLCVCPCICRYEPRGQSPTPNAYSTVLLVSFKDRVPVSFLDPELTDLARPAIRDQHVFSPVPKLQVHTVDITNFFHKFCGSASMS